jgi:hypothetical protein
MKNKLDIRSKLDEIGIAELFAQVLVEKLDIPYEEAQKYVQSKISKQINTVEKHFYEVGSSKEISIDKNKSIEDFIKDNKVIKG